MEKCLLVGLGISNKSAYEVLIKRGYYVDVLVDEQYRNEDYNYVDETVDLDDYKYIIKSPGISSLHRYSKLFNNRDNVINEIELAYILSGKKGKYIAITGSNGKTTSVCMLYDVIKEVYPSVILAGNIGYPLCDYIDYIRDNTIIILELSSFQLETISKMKFYVSSVLSLCPNHLDAVVDLEYYYKSKFNITKNQNNGDYFLCSFNYLKYLENSEVKCIDIDALDFEFESKLRGEFNRKNINVVYAISMILGVDEYLIKKKIKEFNPLKYRVEEIGNICGTSFINDAKSTTVEATIACYEAFMGNKLLICGGKDKGIDFSSLNSIENKCCYGEIRNKLNGYKKESLNELYDYIKRNYKKYDYVIFSPSTSSFDQYKSYMERGEEFESMVERLISEENRA